MLPEPDQPRQSDIPHSAEPRASVHITIDDPYGPEHSHVSILSQLHCTHWTKLEVSGDASWDVTRVIDCFGQAKAVEALSLKDLEADDAAAFFYALNPHFLEFEGRPETSYFPQLQYLYVSGINFGCSRAACDGPLSLGSILNTTLNFRKVAGHELSLLTVKACSVSFDDVWDWGQGGKCTTVEWDDDEGEAHVHLSDVESDGDDGDGNSDQDGEE
ncbi:unnamed protein product [Peniophora sp. CBMAI 1063]|nr:unnamed protein product [Peniophora sp. CBMAI 1063]